MPIPRPAWIQQALADLEGFFDKHGVCHGADNQGYKEYYCKYCPDPSVRSYNALHERDDFEAHLFMAHYDKLEEASEREQQRNQPREELLADDEQAVRARRGPSVRRFLRQQEERQRQQQIDQQRQQNFVENLETYRLARELELRKQHHEQQLQLKEQYLEEQLKMQADYNQQLLKEEERKLNLVVIILSVILLLICLCSVYDFTKSIVRSYINSQCMANLKN